MEKRKQQIRNRRFWLKNLEENRAVTRKRYAAWQRKTKRISQQEGKYRTPWSKLELTTLKTLLKTIPAKDAAELLGRTYASVRSQRDKYRL